MGFFGSPVSGFAKLATSKRFEDVIAVEWFKGLLRTAAQAFSVYAVNELSLPVLGWRRVLASFVCYQIQIGGILFQRLLPDQKYLFLDCVIVAGRNGRSC